MTIILVSYHWFRHSQNNRGDTRTYTCSRQHCDLTSLIFFQDKESTLIFVKYYCDGLEHIID
jgi:hypothetical protein